MMLCESTWWSVARAGTVLERLGGSRRDEMLVQIAANSVLVPAVQDQSCECGSFLRSSEPYPAQHHRHHHRSGTYRARRRGNWGSVKQSGRRRGAPSSVESLETAQAAGAEREWSVRAKRARQRSALAVTANSARVRPERGDARASEGAQSVWRAGACWHLSCLALPCLALAVSCGPPGSRSVLLPLSVFRPQINFQEADRVQGGRPVSPNQHNSEARPPITHSKSLNLVSRPGP